MLGEFKAFPYQAEEVVEAAPMVLVGQAKVALLTSAGLNLKGQQPPFDLEPLGRFPRWATSGQC